MVGHVHAARVVDRVGVDPATFECVFDPGSLRQPEVAALSHRLQTQVARIDPNRVVARVTYIGVRFSAGLHVCTDPTVP